MPRLCTVCSDPSADIINRRLVSGQLLSQVSKEFGVSQPALGRHLRGHVRPVLKAEMRTAQPVDVLDLITRVAAIADDAQQARLDALSAGATAAALRAGDGELRALTTLADRLGVTSQTTFDNLRSAEALTDVVGVIARQHPRVGQLIADRLRDAGEVEFADALAKITPTTERRQLDG